MISRVSILVLGVFAVLAGCRSGRDAAPDGAAPAPPSETAPSEAAPAEAPPEAITDSQCEPKKAAIEAAFTEASHCTSDADCTTFMPGCPFGCFRAIHRSTPTEPISADIAAYNEACNPCVYRCRPLEKPPTCQAGVCTLPPS